MKVQLTDQEVNIIQQMAESQIRSYVRLYTGNTSIDVDLVRIGYHVDKEMVHDELASHIELYEKIKLYPEMMFLLDADDLMLLKDHLLNYADDYEKDGYIPAGLYFKMDLAAFCHEHQN